SFPLAISRINAGARGIQVSSYSIYAGRLHRVQVDLCVVPNYEGLVVLDKSNPSHVRGQSVHFIDSASCLQAVGPPAEVQQLQFVRLRWLELRPCYVHASYPIPELYEVVR